MTHFTSSCQSALANVETRIDRTIGCDASPAKGRELFGVLVKTILNGVPESKTMWRFPLVQLGSGRMGTLDQIICLLWVV